MSIDEIDRLVSRKQARMIRSLMKRDKLRQLEFEPSGDVVARLKDGRQVRIGRGGWINAGLRTLWILFFVCLGIAGGIRIALINAPAIIMGVFWFLCCLSFAGLIEHDRDEDRRFMNFQYRYYERHGHEPPSNWWAG